MTSTAARCDVEGSQESCPGRSVEILSLLSVLLASLLIYREAFLGFFVQDDYGWLVFTRFKNIGEFAQSFFRFNPFGTYRPLGHETFFWLSQSLFGMWPLGFHMGSMAAHFAASLLLYCLLRRFFDLFPSIIGTLLYAVHGAHFLALYWISAFPEPLAMAFYLAALLLFVRFDQKKDLRAYALSIVVMGLGIMSKESALTIPLALFAYCLLIGRSKLVMTLPYFLLSGLYALFRFSSTAVALSPYELTFNRQIGRNLVIYLAWMGGPSDGVIQRGLKWDLSIAHLAAATVFVAIIVLLLSFARNKRIALFAVIWMVFSLQPVLYFSQHNYPYYLAPALAAFSVLAASALSSPRGLKDWARWTPALGIVMLILLSSWATVTIEGRWWNQRTFSRRDLLRKLQIIDQKMPPGGRAFVMGLRSDEAESFENGGILKAYNLPVTRFSFILPGLDAEVLPKLEQLKQSESVRNSYCFVLSDSGVTDQTEAFRINPAQFLTKQQVRHLEIPGVRLEISPGVVYCGKDTLTLRLRNLDAPAIDLLYSIDGKMMPPLHHWLLNREHLATVFVDATTPKGHYHFQAVRDSRQSSDSQWIKVDVSVLVQ